MPKNPELDLAWDFVEKTDRSIFLTGKAGTGKTTFLHSLKSDSLKRLIVVAPTGVAAINAKGVTIHSFFQMPFGPILPDGSSFRKNESFRHKFSKLKINIIRSLDLLIIDEISMVRADLLDGINQVLRKYRDRNKVFGGVQVLMIGDLQQLAPVVKNHEWNILSPYYETPFFFSSKAFQESNSVSIELKHIYRQDNEEFIKILNEIRNNKLTEASAEELNKRYFPNFSPSKNEGYITLTTHNKRANDMNEIELEALKEKSKNYKAIIQGEFKENTYPTHEKLELKVGAQVMFIKNDSNPEKRYFNGKIGKIISLSKTEIQVQCPEDDEEITVTPETWENVNYTIDSNTKEITENAVGSFSQMPLRLAWAITIHKSQGLTFDKAIIDANAAFAHGQTYVALSRCRTLEGVVLKSKIEAQSIITDSRVTSFSENVAENSPNETVLQESQKLFQLNLIEDLLNYYHLLYPVNRLIDLYYKNQNSFQGSILPHLEKMKEEGIQPILKIANSFKNQLLTLTETIVSPENDELVEERIQKAISYFIKHTIETIKTPFEEISFSTEDKALHKDFEKNLVVIEEALHIKMICLKGLSEKFTTSEFLKLRAEAMLQNIEVPKKKREFVAETNHSVLFDALRNLRNIMATSDDVPHFQIFTQRTLYELSNLLPLNKKQLKTIHGMGKIRIEKYGSEILDAINEYADHNNIDVKEITVKDTPLKKEDTKLLSLKMFKEGKSISEIATLRGFVSSTIEGHLASFISTGEMDIYDLIPEEKFLEIQNKIKKLKFEGLTDLRTQLKDAYSYSELRMVVNELDKKE
ncbi:MAG: helix-turn-helix domain-containing protein [Flavobacteriaceae bacterium]|nr:helix-turn-helix domain-containing protein [Flavobacteriaceae bacterium]